MASTTYLRPGSFVEEKLLPVQPTAGPASPPAAFIQTNRRGPITPTKVESWPQYTRLFGGFNGSDILPFSVFSYYNNNGGPAYVSRPVGAGAAVATRTFNDGAAAAALKVDAHNPGTWGNLIFIDITAGSVTGTFNITVHDGDATTATVVERWIDLSMDPANIRFVDSVVNTGSAYIKATALSTVVPANAAGTVLAGGVDGAAPAASDYETNARLLDSVPDPVVLALPGMVTASVMNPILAYAGAREDIFVVVDPPADTDPTAAIAYAGTLTPASSYGAMYYPHIIIGDPSSSARNATRKIPPSGAVVGKIVSNDLSRGVFKAPAGTEMVLNGVSGLERYLTNADRDALNAANVNALLALPNIGNVIYGARTLRRTLEADRYVNVRRTLIHLKRVLKELTAFAVFENNDEALWARIRAVIDTYLAGFWQQGGLKGSSASQAYYVVCDASINSNEQIAQGYLNVEVGVSLQVPAEFIVIRLGQFQGTITATDSLAA